MRSSLINVSACKGTYNSFAAVYIQRSAEPVVRTEEVVHQVILFDFDQNENLVGVEVFAGNEFTEPPPNLKRIDVRLPLGLVAAEPSICPVLLTLSLHETYALDASYIRFGCNQVALSKEIDKSACTIDLDKSGGLVGIRIRVRVPPGGIDAILKQLDVDQRDLLVKFLVQNGFDESGPE